MPPQADGGQLAAREMMNGRPLYHFMRGCGTALQQEMIKDTYINITSSILETLNLIGNIHIKTAMCIL